MMQFYSLNDKNKSYLSDHFFQAIMKIKSLYQ